MRLVRLMTPDDWARMSWHARARYQHRMRPIVSEPMPCQRCLDHGHEINDLLARLRELVKNPPLKNELIVELTLAEARLLLTTLTPDSPEEIKERQQLLMMGARTCSTKDQSVALTARIEASPRTTTKTSMASASQA